MVEKQCRGKHKDGSSCRHKAVLLGYCLKHYVKYLYKPKKREVEGGKNGKKKEN